MAAFTTEQLVRAVRDSGLYKPEQLAALDAVTPELLADPPALADKLLADKLLTAYQARKVRLNRLHEVLLGPYLVLDKIGEGGMGKVYKAAQAKTGRLVALKVVRPHLMANPTVVKRYRREAAAAAKLNHPNIVTLLDADEAQGRYYLALEFVYGSDLSRMVKEFGPLPGPEAAEYVRQAALGLQHAHDNGFVHRDVKPSNMLVSGERALPGTGGVAHVRLLDMGLIRSLVEEDDLAKSELTRDGTVVGTPDYMSPEQAKNSSTVDHRADVYSLGCTLFYLLAGKPPFPDGSPIDKLLRHQLDPPPDLRKQRPDVPFEVHRLLGRMLAKKPEERVNSAADVAKVLAQCTTEGLASVPDLVLKMPDPTPADGPPPGSTVVTAPVQVLEAEVVEAAPPEPAAPIRPVRPRPAVKLVPRTADGSDSFPRPKRHDDSDSLPGAADETRSRTRDADTPTPARKRPPKPRVPEKGRKPSANWLPAAVGFGVVTLLVAVALVFALKGERKPVTPPPEANKDDPPPKPVLRPILPPAWANVPDDAALVVVAHPQAYWLAARQHVPPASRFAKAVNELTNRYHFDPRLGERYTLARLGGRGGGWVATVEGQHLTPEWAAAADAWPGVTSQTIDGQKFLAFPPQGDLTVHGRLGGPRPGYSIAGSEALVVELARRPAGQKPKLAEGVLAALPDSAGPNPPTFTFAATGRLPVADGVTLGDLGAELVVLHVRLADDKFDVDVAVGGKGRAPVQDFVNLTLWPKVNAAYPPLKPFLRALAENTSNAGWDKVGPLDVLRKAESGVWSFADVQDALEKLLPE